MCRTDDDYVMIKLMMMTMKKKSDEMCRTAGLYIPSFLSNRYKSASSPCHDSNDDDMMMMTIMVIMLMMIMMSKLYNRYKSASSAQVMIAMMILLWIPDTHLHMSQELCS